MIFSIICEELGFVGATILMLVFLMLIWRFMVIAVHAPDLFGSLIAAGPWGHIAIPGDFKCSRCDKHDSEYRDHTSVYQLWRHFRFVSALGDGAGFGSQPVAKREKMHMIIL